MTRSVLCKVSSVQRPHTMPHHLTGQALLISYTLTRQLQLCLCVCVFQCWHRLCQIYGILLPVAQDRVKYYRALLRNVWFQKKCKTYATLSLVTASASHCAATMLKDGYSIQTTAYNSTHYVTVKIDDNYRVSLNQLWKPEGDNSEGPLFSTLIFYDQKLCKSITYRH